MGGGYERKDRHSRKIIEITQVSVFDHHQHLFNKYLHFKTKRLMNARELASRVNETLKPNDSNIRLYTCL